MSRHIAIVTPVFDDWESLTALIAEIAERFEDSGIVFHVLAVDDGSSAPLDLAGIAAPPGSCIADIEIVGLALNLGHQRAIATGLCAAVDRRDVEAVIVMDSDGEDRPVDIAKLLAAAERQPGQVILAHRAKRSETRGFRFWYAVYKLLFRALTGRVINFGNYALLPMRAVRRLVHMPELWNNLAAAIMRSRLPYITVPTERGTRYAGRSSMNLVALVVHGLSAMSVYTDMIFVRVLIAAGTLGAVSVLGIIGVTLIRFATDLAIPGWATAMVGDLFIILLQTVVIVIATSLMMLAGRSNRPIIPIVDAWPFVAGRQSVERGRAAASPRWRAQR
jgi:glycosyltransferase involved in cell wall biosynthesis